ncbi:protein-disulfide reductase DsbD family protein [Devosia algicola]|uniref:Protein-disulfide reductase DsbD family protein n=1 Tax=Devosia algicola TaxID=3026418 RepID=A0ABY7YN75_9HYPH|nr:protein-disulfide reductase DsbD domain-containing protein [Devosia algicola]WDR02515.1 protein-disulfide reductase DsbD family protein [Devosia algicola]
MKALTVLIFALLPATTTIAAETAWQEVAPDVKLRLVSSGQIKSDGQTMVGLEITMPPNTRTYWRIPGQSGIPAQLDATGSVGVNAENFIWPHPSIQVADGYTDFVYWGDTLLPIAIATSGAAPELDLTVTLGICSDICVPAQASFALPLQSDRPDSANGLRIRQAVAEAPIDWPNDHPPAIANVAYRPDLKSIAVRLADPAIDPATMIAATQTGDPLFGAPQKSPEPNVVLLPILGKFDEKALKSLPVQALIHDRYGGVRSNAGRRTVAPFPCCLGLRVADRLPAGAKPLIRVDTKFWIDALLM